MGRAPKKAAFCPLRLPVNCWPHSEGSACGHNPRSAADVTEALRGVRMWFGSGPRSLSMKEGGKWVCWLRT